MNETLGFSPNLDQKAYDALEEWKRLLGNWCAQPFSGTGSAHLVCRLKRGNCIFALQPSGSRG